MPIPIPGCDCSDCRSARWRTTLYGEMDRRGYDALADVLNKQRSAMASPFSNATFEIRIDPSYFNLGGSSMSPSFPPNDPTTPQGIANAVKSLAAKDQQCDLSGIKATVENIEAERKERVVTALKGVADLEILNGAKAKRFALVYWRGGEAKTAYGTEYLVERDDDGDPIGYSVYLDDYHHAVVSTKYDTMKTLRESLEERKTPYHIAYFDK